MTLTTRHQKLENYTVFRDIEVLVIECVNPDKVTFVSAYSEVVVTSSVWKCIAGSLEPDWIQVNFLLDKLNFPMSVDGWFYLFKAKKKIFKYWVKSKTSGGLK